MENEIPQIETRYRRIYRTFESEDGKKTYDLLIRHDSDRSTISTIQSEKSENGNQTLSVFLKEGLDKVVLELWTGFVSDTLRKYERQFVVEIEYNIGMSFMSEVYDNALHTYSHYPTVARISDKMVEFAKIQEKEMKAKI